MWLGIVVLGAGDIAVNETKFLSSKALQWGNFKQSHFVIILNK